LQTNLKKLLFLQKRKEISTECCSETYQFLQHLFNTGEISRSCFLEYGKIILGYWEETSGQDDDRLVYYKKDFCGV
jgi:hypothetical protein